MFSRFPWCLLHFSFYMRQVKWHIQFESLARRAVMHTTLSVIGRIVLMVADTDPLAYFSFDISKNLFIAISLHVCLNWVSVCPWFFFGGSMSNETQFMMVILDEAGVLLLICIRSVELDLLQPGNTRTSLNCKWRYWWCGDQVKSGLLWKVA